MLAETNRSFTDMIHNSMSRPAAEEWNLATFLDDQDVTNAEFLRTWQSRTFPGVQLVQRLEDEMKGRRERGVCKLLPEARRQERKADNEIVKACS